MRIRPAASPEASRLTATLQQKADWLGRHIMPHEPMLRLWLKSRELRGLEIEDIVQDTYTRILSLASFDHITSPRTYAFQVASSVMMDHLRRLKIVSIDAMSTRLARWRRSLRLSR